MDYYMKQFFERRKSKLQILTMKGMSEAVARFMDKSDKESVREIVK